MLYTKEITEYDDTISMDNVRRRIHDLATDDLTEMDILEELKSLIDLCINVDDTEVDTLINCSALEDYAIEHAESTIPDFNALKWPHTHIDWESAGEELVENCDSVEFNGISFYALTD